jgi:hypothetical protein
MPELRQIVPDKGVRAYKNGNASTLPAKRLCKGTTTEGQIDLATAVGDKPAGVSMEAIPTGLFGDVQTGGKAKVTAGGVVAVNDRITTDGAGKGVAAAPAAGVNNAIWGIAKTAASGDGVDFEMELSPEGTVIQGA